MNLKETMNKFKKQAGKVFGGSLFHDDTWRQYYSNGLTPVKLREYLELADQGDVYAQYQLFDEMEEKDTHLYSELQKRKMAVTKWDWRIVPSDEKDKTAIQISERVEQIIGAISDFEDDLLDIMDALGKGVSFTEINWENSEGDIFIKDIDNIEQWHFVPDKKEWKILTKENPIHGEILPDNKFITHVMRAKSGSPVRSGLSRICSYMYLFKNYAIKDWLIFLELYGIPFRVGKYGQGTGDKEKQVLKNAVYGLGVDGAGVISRDTEIEIISGMSGNSSNVHEYMAKFCNREMSKAILGTVSSSDRGTGTYAEEKANLEVRDDLNKADIRSLCSTLRRDLIRPVVLFNFGEEAVKKYLPYFEFIIEAPIDLKAEAETDKIVIKEIGLPVSKEYLYSKYNLPAPKDENDVLEVPEYGYPMSRISDTQIVPLKKKYSQGLSAQKRTLRMRPE